MTVVAHEGSSVEVKPDSTVWVFLAGQLVAGLLWLGAFARRVSTLEKQMGPLLKVDARLAAISAEVRAGRRDISRLYRHLVPHAGPTDHDDDEEGEA